MKSESIMFSLVSRFFGLRGAYSRQTDRQTDEGGKKGRRKEAKTVGREGGEGRAM
jgi:hypothetical protein